MKTLTRENEGVLKEKTTQNEIPRRLKGDEDAAKRLTQEIIDVQHNDSNSKVDSKG